MYLIKKGEYFILILVAIILFLLFFYNNFERKEEYLFLNNLSIFCYIFFSSYFIV